MTIFASGRGGITRRKSAAPPAFSPDDITGMVAWLDGGLSSKTYASGSLVSQWNDMSGQAHHATFPAGKEADDAVRAINGIPALDFNSATPDYATLPDGLGLNTTFHTFVVLIIDTNSSGARVVFAGCSTTTNDGYQLAQTTLNRLFLYTCDGVARHQHVPSGLSFTPGTAFLAEVWGDGTTEVGIGINGVTEAEVPANGCVTPDECALMAGNTGLSPTDGALAAVYIYDHKLSAGDRTDLLSYISNRFGISV